MLIIIHEFKYSDIFISDKICLISVTNDLNSGITIDKYLYFLKKYSRRTIKKINIFNTSEPLSE